MIKIFHRPRKTHTRNIEAKNEDGTTKTKTETYEDVPTSKFTVSETDSTIKIGFKTLFLENEVEDSFEIDKTQYVGKIIYCALVQSSTAEYRVAMYPEMQIITSASLNKPRGKAANETPLARICFEEDGDANIFFFHRIDDIEGFENIQIPVNQNSSMFLLEHSEIYKKIRQKYDLKAKMLSEIDQLDTLVYLEIQIDAIASLVLKLWESTQKTETNETKILAEGAKHSVLDVKTLESCLEEINRNKTLIRNLQQEYIKQKQELCD